MTSDLFSIRSRVLTMTSDGILLGVGLTKRGQLNAQSTRTIPGFLHDVIPNGSVRETVTSARPLRKFDTSEKIGTVCMSRMS